MIKNGFRLRVPVHCLLLLGSLILLPAWARADDFSIGDSGNCSDPSIGPSLQFSFSANTHGGLCLAFGNHSGVPIHSLTFTTSIPDANSDLNVCSGGIFFTNCDYVPNTANGTLTIEFFGGRGIPAISVDTTDNFIINLNNPDPTTGMQPNNNTVSGDWLTNGSANTFSGAANGVPEPASALLLLTALGATVARIRMVRSGRR